MFQEIYQLALTTPLVMTISASAESGNLTLNVIPTPKKSEKAGDSELALTQKLSLTASPEEFDASFPQCLTNYTASYKSLVEQVETSTAVLEAAKKAQVDKTSSAAKNAGKPPAKTPAKLAPLATEDEETDEVEGEGSKSTEESLFD